MSRFIEGEIQEDRYKQVLRRIQQFIRDIELQVKV